VLVPVLTEQFSDWHPYGFWPPVSVVWRAERGADLGVFRSAGERGGEGIRVGNASRQIGAYVPLVIWLQTINAAQLLGLVELGWIFEVCDPAHVGFFRNRAFVAYVAVPGALIYRCNDSA
jgi:hypothetical protein